MVSDFILTASAVAALAPKSHGRYILLWIYKWTDEFGKEFADTAGRVLYFMALVLGCTFIEWLFK